VKPRAPAGIQGAMSQTPANPPEPIPSTMKAVRIHRHGGPEVLSYEDAPVPEPAAGEVLVRVHAAGVNPVDWKVRSSASPKSPRALPAILGWDVSGTVARLGDGVSSFALGDAVYSRPDIARDGAYAEYMVVRASELAAKPRSIDHVHAAALPLAGLTAWQALFEAAPPFSSAGLERGQTVLIHAGAGGVGSLAIQLAKWRGARVLATASTDNQAFLRELGADVAIDYTRERFEDVARDVDVVFDTMGGEVQTRSWSVLRKGGVLVTILSPPSPEAAQAAGARAAYVFVQPNAAQLGELARLVDDQVVRPIVSAVLPLPEARKAHELSQAGHVRGKIVLQVVGL
jgi:NADPH:quinone reductase-like Zn-dependent oxidoreductase